MYSCSAIFVKLFTSNFIASSYTNIHRAQMSHINRKKAVTNNGEHGFPLACYLPHPNSSKRGKTETKPFLENRAQGDISPYMCPSLSQPFIQEILIEYSRCTRQAARAGDTIRSIIQFLPLRKLLSRGKRNLQTITIQQTKFSSLNTVLCDSKSKSWERLELEKT